MKQLCYRLQYESVRIFIDVPKQGIRLAGTKQGRSKRPRSFALFCIGKGRGWRQGRLEAQAKKKRPKGLIIYFCGNRESLPSGFTRDDTDVASLNRHGIGSGGVDDNGRFVVFWS